MKTTAPVGSATPCLPAWTQSCSQIAHESDQGRPSAPSSAAGRDVPPPVVSPTPVSYLCRPGPFRCGVMAEGTSVSTAGGGVRLRPHTVDTRAGRGRPSHRIPGAHRPTRHAGTGAAPSGSTPTRRRSGSCPAPRRAPHRPAVAHHPRPPTRSTPRPQVCWATSRCGHARTPPSQAPSRSPPAAPSVSVLIWTGQAAGAWLPAEPGSPIGQVRPVQADRDRVSAGVVGRLPGQGEAVVGEPSQPQRRPDTSADPPHTCLAAPRCRGVRSCGSFGDEESTGNCPYPLLISRCDLSETTACATRRWLRGPAGTRRGCDGSQGCGHARAVTSCLSGRSFDALPRSEYRQRLGGSEPEPESCAVPGTMISDRAQEAGPPGQVFKDFAGIAPGQVISAYRTRGRS
jgi:hypothetical protein